MKAFFRFRDDGTKTAVHEGFVIHVASANRKLGAVLEYAGLNSRPRIIIEKVFSKLSGLSGSAAVLEELG